MSRARHRRRPLSRSPSRCLMCRSRSRQSAISRLDVARPRSRVCSGPRNRVDQNLAAIAALAIVALPQLAHGAPARDHGGRDFGQVLQGDTRTDAFFFRNIGFNELEFDKSSGVTVSGPSSDVTADVPVLAVNQPQPDYSRNQSAVVSDPADRGVQRRSRARYRQRRSPVPVSRLPRAVCQRHVDVPDRGLADAMTRVC